MPNKPCEDRLNDANERIEHLTELLNIDYVTGLPVRRRLEAVMAPSMDPNNPKPFALGVVRLDARYARFRHNRETANVLLYVTGQRLCEIAPGRVFQSWRLDEFIIVTDDPKKLSAIHSFGEEVRDTVETPHRHSGVNLRLGCYVGFAIYPDHGATVSELLENAEIALGIVEQKDSSAIVYEPDMGLRRNRQYEIEQAITEAIQDGFSQFSLAFQPIVDAERTLHGVEALARWTHPRLGQISPGEFVPIAEQYGQIHILGLWVVFHATQLLRQSDQLNRSLPVVSLNVSGVQLRDIDFAERVVEVMRTAGGDPRRFRLELTETAIIDDPEHAKKTLSTLRDHGIKVMIDDFGTGCSSFSYLQQLPIDTIKIAKEFVDEVHVNENSLAIVRSIIQMASGLGATSLAEGIETQEQFEVLRAEGCDYYQGYFFGRPVVTSNVEDIYRGDR